jgi:hypothetical protein
MRNTVQSLAAGILLSLLPSPARSEIIQLNCVGGDTEADFDLAYQTVKENDYEAMGRMLLSGKVHYFSKGDIVSVTGHGGFLSSLVRVRKRGEIESYYLPYEWVKDSTPPEQATKSSSNERTAEPTPTSSPAFITESAPPPKPTPVPAAALSTPKGFDGKVTGIKLFLNQDPATWTKYYGTKPGPRYQRATVSLVRRPLRTACRLRPKIT